MKTKILYLFISTLFIYSCHELDLNPLSEGSSENWYSDETELSMSLNYLFGEQFWRSMVFYQKSSWAIPAWKGYGDDDFLARGTLQYISDGSMNGQTTIVVDTWDLAYQAIASANTFLGKIDNATGKLSEKKLNQFAANARFVRASQYAELIFRFGDIPFYTGQLDIDEALNLSRTKKEDVLEEIYNDYNFAIDNLPNSYAASETQYATKGAAMAMKARIALYMKDYQTARDAAMACMNLGVYNLHPDFSDLFVQNSLPSSNEIIFGTARSLELKKTLSIREQVTRNAGGWSNGGPSWELLAAFLCSDGLPIDESPLFDPSSPFDNRDPRCIATIVEFQTPWFGYMYQPHPDSLVCYSFNDGKYVQNTDTRSVQQYCSYNALVLKKFLAEDRIENQATDIVNIMMRYADVLLMYAEAKIELDEIDQSVVDAINKVRARAYGVDYTQSNLYPVVNLMNQDELRKILRMERRMEFAWEGWRYNDLIRWRLAEKALTKKLYGILDPDELREKVVKPGLWFWPITPEIDDDGLVNFDPMYESGYCKLLNTRAFDASRNYLWPIPSTEIQTNPNLKQNPGY